MNSILGGVPVVDTGRHSTKLTVDRPALDRSVSERPAGEEPIAEWPILSLPKMR